MVDTDIIAPDPDPTDPDIVDPGDPDPNPAPDPTPEPTPEPDTEPDELPNPGTVFNANQMPKTLSEDIHYDVGGVFLKFDPTNPGATDIPRDMLFGTTGGITLTLTPHFIDMFADVDNAPSNVAEGKILDYWEATLTTTMLTYTAQSLKRATAAADLIVDPITKLGQVVPRGTLKMSDYADELWFVGSKQTSDGNTKGIAHVLHKALSTSGVTIKTGKKTKTTVDVTFTAHYSLEDQQKVPWGSYEFQVGDFPLNAPT